MDKIVEKFNFIQRGQFDVSEIKKAIDKLEYEWLEDTSRQDVFFTHKDTQSYYLYRSDLHWNFHDNFVSEKSSGIDSLLDLVEPIIADLEEQHDGVRGNVLLINLPAGKQIPRHRDEGPYLTLVRRHHIPIVTNDQMSFIVANEKMFMKEGECWEINNSKTHSVSNIGDTDRIHLLVDIMPNAAINKTQE